jgi:hypothetical protein
LVRGDVDAVAIEFVAFDDHLVEIDAEAQFDAAVRHARPARLAAA